MKLITPYLDKKYLIKMKPQVFKSLETNTQNFITWLRAGALTQNISDADALKFAAVAFTMPKLTDEFEKLLLFLKKAENLDKIVTQNIVHNALMTQNVKGFELLLPLIAKDRNLVNVIRDELNTMGDIDDETRLYNDIMKNFKPSIFSKDQVRKMDYLNLYNLKYNQVMVEKIRTLIKNETGKPSTGKGDIVFHFSK